MKIIYIAYSCDPYKGSEDKIGWYIPYEMSRNNENQVFVVTKEEHRKTIQEYCKSNIVRMKFFYVDINRIFKKIFKGSLASAKLNIWHRNAFYLVKELCEKEEITLIHQINPVEFRSIGKYYRIFNSKFVCGPIGGGEYIPRGLWSYSKRYIGTEIIRFIANSYYLLKLNCSLSKRKNVKLLFANEETRKLFGKKHKNDILYTEIGTSEILDYEPKSDKKQMVFMTCGRLVYRKGIEFLLDAINLIPYDLQFEFLIIGDGIQKEYLMNKCTGNINKDKIYFLGKINHQEIIEYYKKADCFVYPSIRETGGAVILEAFSSGVPVITINKYGGRLIINEKNGYLYEGDSKINFKENLKNILCECINNPNSVCEKRKYALETAKNYTWEKKILFYSKIYENM